LIICEFAAKVDSPSQVRLDLTRDRRSRLRVFRFGRLLVALLAFTLLAPGVATADSHSMQMDHGSMQMEDGDTMRMMDDALADLEALEGEEFEVAYVNQIIPHHQGALEMAQSVVDRAPHQEVRDAAARVIEDQQREIKELTAFLQEKYGRQVQPDQRMAMDPSMMEQMNDADPAMAEKMFLLGMREHHEIALQMGEIALQKAQSQEILTQAENMVSSQRAEQEEFAGYLRNFYGIQAPAPTGDMEAAMRLAMDSGMQMPETGGPSLPGMTVLMAAVLAMLAAGAYVVRKVLG
jgi:uncharacterized protein (DUF305 family)